MFVNRHRIIAIVPASTVSSKRGEVLRLEDEVAVSIPCFFDRKHRVMRTGYSQFVEIAATVSASAAVLPPSFGIDAYLRFEHDKNVYYRVQILNENDGIFGEQGQVDAELTRVKTPIRSTDARSVPSGVETSSPVSVPDPDPTKTKDLWGG